MTIDELPIVMARCLFFTILIELIVALILKVRDKKDILNIILVNTMTNPLLVSLTVYITYNRIFNRTLSVIVLELLVVLIEGFTYKKVLKYKKINSHSFVFSII